MSLTSHEYGYYSDLSKDVEARRRPMDKIAHGTRSLLEQIKDEGNRHRNREQKKLDARRDDVLARIAEASEKHGIDRSLFAARIRLAVRARISEAESMADLAENFGDFVSPLFFLELKDGEHILWKGYVIGTMYNGKVIPRVFASGTYLSCGVVVYLTPEDDYVSVLTDPDRDFSNGRWQDSASVGIFRHDKTSRGRRESVDCSVNSACRAYACSLGGEFSDLAVSCQICD